MTPSSADHDRDSGSDKSRSDDTQRSRLDHGELLDGLAAGVLPEQLPDWPQVKNLLPIFELCHSMFYHTPAKSALKLLIILALAKVEGRFTKERVRSLVPALDSKRLDDEISTLHRGGWLELRASDNSYRVRPLGLYLLSVLLAADFANQTTSNLLIRAIEATQFSQRLSPDGQTTGYLLSVLLAELETQAADAREIIRRGTPRQMIRFSRQQVQLQIEHVMQVLLALEQRMDEASQHFGRVIAIHDALQVILRAHEGLTRRLAEWSLKRLETSDTGYSLAALTDAALGASDEELMQLVDHGTIRPYAPSVCLATEQLLTRHQTGRRSMAREKREFVYQAPSEPVIDELQLAEVDPVTRLKQRITAWLEAARGDAVELSHHLAEEADDFADAVYQLNMLARIQGLGDGDSIQLTPALTIRIAERALDPRTIHGLSVRDAIAQLVREGVLVAVEGKGLHPAIDIHEESRA